MRLRISKSKMQLNKGFTLVELIVSIAIFAIVAAAIIAFFRVAMAQYRTNTNEVNIQTESQMAWKRLESNILTATNGIWTPTMNQIDLYNSKSVNDKTVQTKTSIYYTPGGEKHSVYYQDYVLDENNTWQAQGNPQVFAKLVTRFEVKLYDKDDHIIDGSGNLLDEEGNSSDENGVPYGSSLGVRPYRAKAHIEYDANGRTYTSDNTVAIRNTVVASSDINVIYANNENNKD